MSPARSGVAAPSEAELLEAAHILDEVDRRTDDWSAEVHRQAALFYTRKPTLKKVKRGKLKGAEVLTSPSHETLKSGAWKGVRVLNAEGRQIECDLAQIACRRNGVQTLRRLIDFARERSGR